MSEFNSWLDYWIFSRKISEEYRYIHDEWIDNFLKVILETVKTRSKFIEKGRILYRAQLGHRYVPIKIPDKSNGKFGWKIVGESSAPFSFERMKPLPDQATEGRANPKGIPYLYLATKKETALSEVRPWIGSLITLADFKIVKKLKIVDCSKDKAKKIWYMGEEPSRAEKEQVIWTLINHAFSIPVTPSDNTPDYCPTQFLAEFFKRNNFDGIIYKSMLGNLDGCNVVLFDLDAAKINNASSYSAQSLHFEFEENLENKAGSLSLYSQKLDKKYKHFLKD